MPKDWMNIPIRSISTNNNVEYIPFPKEEVVMLIDQIVRLHSIQLADTECNEEIYKAMKTLNEALALLVKTPRIIIGEPK
jgi:hypothetical protein